jgi:hypothetical protein
VALLHALPRRLWPSTALGEPATLAVNQTPGGPNRDLRKRRAWWTRGRRIDERRIPIPVLGLDPASVHRWAEMFAARRGQTAPAFLVATEAQAAGASARRRPAPTMRERVDLFRGHAPDAFRLAVRLAVGPFTMPILRLVQSSLFGANATHSQAAEVMLSGFVTRLTSVGADTAPEQVQFQFNPEAAAVLLESLRRDDARELAALVQGYVQQQFGTPRDQLVYLEDPKGPALMPAGARPFKVFSDGFVEWLRKTTPARSGTPAPPLARVDIEQEVP